MCKICKHEGCTGKYLLHPKELKFVPLIKERELAKDPDYKFELVDSPSSGEMFTKFKELHVYKEA